MAESKFGYRCKTYCYFIARRTVIPQMVASTLSRVTWVFLKFPVFIRTAIHVLPKKLKIVRSYVTNTPKA